MNAQNSTLSLGRDILVSTGQDVANNLIATNTANFSSQINKINVLIGGLPTFTMGTKQNLERNWQVDLDVFLLNGRTSEIKLNGTKQITQTAATTTGTATDVVVAPTASPGSGDGGGTGTGRGSSSLEKRQSESTSIDSFGVWEEIRKLMIFYYWTITADFGQVSRLSPLANATAMAAYNLTCSPIACDQLASQNVQTRSTIFTNYLCSKSRPKTPLALFISVMVANIVLLSTGYQIIFLISSMLAKRRDSTGFSSINYFNRSKLLSLSKLLSTTRKRYSIDTSSSQRPNLRSRKSWLDGCARSL
jgi:hypothetical protein